MKNCGNSTYGRLVAAEDAAEGLPKERACRNHGRDSESQDTSLMTENKCQQETNTPEMVVE